MHAYIHTNYWPHKKQQIPGSSLPFLPSGSARYCSILSKETSMAAMAEMAKGMLMKGRRSPWYTLSAAKMVLASRL